MNKLYIFISISIIIFIILMYGYYNNPPPIHNNLKGLQFIGWLKDLEKNILNFYLYFNTLNQDFVIFNIQSFPNDLLVLEDKKIKSDKIIKIGNTKYIVVIDKSSNAS